MHRAYETGPEPRPWPARTGWRVAAMLSATAASLACAPTEPLSLTLLSHRPGQLVAPLDTVRFELGGSRIRGLDSWRPTLEVVAVDETTGVEEQVERRERRSFGQDTWNVSGDFLGKDGRTALFLRATQGNTTVETGPLYVEVYPRLTGVALLGASEAAPALPGQPLAIRVEGVDLWRPVQVEVQELVAGVAPTTVERLSAAPRAEPTRLVLSGPVTKRLGEHVLRLVARYGEQQVTSALFKLQVDHVLDEVRVFARRNGTLEDITSRTAELRHLDNVGDGPELVIRARGQALRGQTLTFLFTAEEGRKELARSTVTAESDELFVSYRVSSADFMLEQPIASLQLAATLGWAQETARTRLQRWGIDGCGWVDGSGLPIPAGTHVHDGWEVGVSVRTWGLSRPGTGAALGATFRIRETEQRSTQAPLQELWCELSESSAAAPWTARYPPELVPWTRFSARNEYLFEVEAGGLTCTSALLYVQR